MKKVLGGKVYDTETAEKCGEDSQGRPNDFRWVCETLYRKRTGEFFIHGEGGARSQYAESIGSSWYNGEKIIPISYEDAQKWAEERLDGDEYLAIFGDPEEDSTEALMVRVSAQAKAKLDREASRSGKTRAQIIEDLLQTLD